MGKVTQFARDWALVIAIIFGIVSYIIYIQLPLPPAAHVISNRVVAVAQPAMIFAMLFLTFSRIDPRALRPRMWHLWLLLIQGGLFAAISGLLILFPHTGFRVPLEGTMILLICPTATAAAVITKKLHGNINDITAYTILINLLATLLIPTFQPLVHPTPGTSFTSSALLILGKVFPLLLLPLITAQLVRLLFPRLNSLLVARQELSFYIWAVSLSLAIAVTTRSIFHTHTTLATQLWLVVTSLLACLFQFWAGRRIGSRYGDTVTAGQALGQKNTVLAIWVGYTFFTPVTAIAGGFYSIWHNVINTLQLRRANHAG
ncbi:MAG: transporter [Muribaculaceae bacterium]|nr:transporter [Muribaculaceae bacterium]